MSLLGSIVQGVSNFGSSLIGASTSRKNTKRTIRAQKELAEYSYAKDKEMWDAANEYNSPSEQMKRLKDAGLNPNLIYGTGSVVGNTSTQTPKYQQHDPQYKHTPVELPNVAGILQQFQDLKIKGAQVDNLTAETRRKEIENFYLAENLGHKNKGLFLENLRKAGLYGQDKFSPDFTSKAFQDSPYMKQFQSTTKQKILDNQMKQIDINLSKQGVSRSDNVLLRMLIQAGLFNPNQLLNFKK